MRNVRILGAAVTAVLMIVATLTPALAASDRTVGEFVVAFAKARNLNAIDAQTASNSLARVGIRLPADINYAKRLTEADVAKISRAAGLNVTTTNPDAPFDADQVERFFATFAGEIGDGGRDGSGGISTQTDLGGNGNGNGPPFDPLTKGKKGGKGKGKFSSTPFEPE